MTTPRSILNLILALVVIGVGTACHHERHTSSSGVGSTARTTSTRIRSYWFIFDGCSTEKHTFYSDPEFCAGLQDESLNNNCAPDLRRTEFAKRGCPGDFKSFFGRAAAATGPGNVRCTGEISGTTGRKAIDKVITWAGTAGQRFVLSDYGNPKDAGQYTVDLIPDEDPTKPATVRLGATFIDNKKGQYIMGSLGAAVNLRHRDELLNDRSVDITCDLERPATPPPAAPAGPLEIWCMGSTSGTGRADATTARLVWDQKSAVTAAFEDKDSKPVELNLRAEIDANGRPTLKIFSEYNGGRTQVYAESHGRLDLTLKYVSAVDDRKFDVACQTATAWRAVITDGAKRAQGATDAKPK